MESFNIKPLNLSFIIFFLLFPCVLSAVSTDSLLPPITSIIPQILDFLDKRLAILYPIVQGFKNTITQDPLNITGTWVGSDVCHYKGFYCSNPPDNESATTVASIDLNSYHLSAPSLDGFIDQLSDVAIFHANSNNFSGTLSENFSKLPYLYELDLSNNNLSGPFPVEVLYMKDLEYLDIRFNSFSGAIPPEIFTREGLESLFLNNNNFTENIPEDIGSTPAAYITLANNQLTGPIPKSIGNAASTLTEVSFFNNQLTGCLPYEIGLLKEAMVFDASNNQITGPLPSSLGCMEKLELFSLANNKLRGKVPEALCELGSLVNVSLSNNYFTNVGPICKKLIKQKILDMDNNCVPDLPNQRSVKECTAFYLNPSVCPDPSSYELIPCRTVEAPSSNSPTKSKSVAPSSNSPTESKSLAPSSNSPTGSNKDSVANKTTDQRLRF